MTMGLIPLKCVNCGGALETTANAEVFRCQYCKQLMLLARPANPSEAVRTATKLVSRKEWGANFQRSDNAGLNWQGGTAHLTDDTIVFVPHSFNFGPLERVALPVASIVDIKLDTGFISDDVTVTANDGIKWTYRVRKGEELRDALQALRR